MYCPNQPRIDFSCHKYVPRLICSLICAVQCRSAIQNSVIISWKNNRRVQFLAHHCIILQQEETRSSWLKYAEGYGSDWSPKWDIPGQSWAWLCGIMEKSLKCIRRSGSRTKLHFYPGIEVEFVNKRVQWLRNTSKYLNFLRFRKDNVFCLEIYINREIVGHHRCLRTLVVFSWNL